nr:MAG TPA: hypothetical protein [Caudoviricetes sp.]
MQDLLFSQIPLPDDFVCVITSGRYPSDFSVG